MAVHDKRRTDVRTNVRINPFWLKSAEFGHGEASGEAVLFGFPEVGGTYFIHEMVVDVTTAFSTDVGITGIGYGTVNTACDAITSGDPDKYMAAGEITADVIQKYLGGLVTHAYDTGVMTGTLWGSAKAAINTSGATGGTDLAGLRNQLIVGADYETMPAIYATIAASQTVGVARLYLLVSRLQ